MAKKKKGSRVKNIQVSALQINERALTRRISGKVREQVEKKVETKAKDSVRKLVKKYGLAAQDSVRRNLSRGFGGVSSGGVKRAVFTTPLGKQSHYSTPSWQPLTPGYLNRTPKSKVFWRKHRSSADYRRGSFSSGIAQYSPLLADFKSVAKTPVYATSSRSKVVEKGKKSYNIDWVVNVRTGLPEPLNVYIIGSLVQARAVGGSIRFPGVSKKDVTRIAYVEGRRPFIGGMSAAMGRRMYKDIDKAFKVKLLTQRK